jgi:hypothetical protein
MCSPCRGYIKRSSCDYDSLETAVTIVGGWCEMAASLGVTVSWSNELLVRQSPASTDVNTEAEEAMALEAVTRQQQVKIKKTEKT